MSVTRADDTFALKHCVQRDATLILCATQGEQVRTRFKSLFIDNIFSVLLLARVFC